MSNEVFQFLEIGLCELKKDFYCFVDFYFVMLCSILSEDILWVAVDVGNWTKENV